MTEQEPCLYRAASIVMTNEGVRSPMRVGRWIAAGTSFLIAVSITVWAVGNPSFEWSVVREYLTSPKILDGLWVTLWLTVAVTILSITLGVLQAGMRLSQNPVLNTVAWFYIWIFRSTPLLVQLLFWFNIGYFIPAFTISLPWSTYSVRTVDIISPITAALLGLTMHTVAYAGEIIRGGILSVSHGQTEAGEVLGMSATRIFFRIVLPQSLRSIIPAMGNLLVDTLKNTSIVSVLAVNDLLYSAQTIYNSNYKIVPLLLVATIWYVTVTSLLSIAQKYLERHFSKGTVKLKNSTNIEKSRKIHIPEYFDAHEKSTKDIDSRVQK
ncbi:hypothetical protein BS297_27340 [Rhodococcus erythropolis]|uniref:ABC transmembrane type-1 domain-containing protein n=1 Tax=Rhodococcus erythropolis TaxID=1833 RepID=A0A5N5DXC9_RHOER|nr:hypothetical protein BS297_27340 [Rhodococcus erythropolis]